jgi:surface antigen
VWNARGKHTLGRIQKLERPKTWDTSTMKQKLISILSVLLVAVFAATERPSFLGKHTIECSEERKIGTPVDSFNGVTVYYNGPISNVSGRNLAEDNYNLGLKYQCVEFVKRYYYEYYRHKMPDSYGHAKDFFDDNLNDGVFNEKRALTQYRNPSQSQPKVGDLVIFGGHISNRYGHVAIISNVSEEEIEIIQQNPGKSKKSRVNILVSFQNGLWHINNGRILGWLRKNTV